MPTAPHAWIAVLLPAAAGLALLYAAVTAALFLGQRYILFRPDRTVPEIARMGVPALGSIGVRTADGLELFAWHLPPRAADAPVVLFLHGNAGHVGHRGQRIRHFADRGWGALLVEYRGFGGNPGTPTEAGLRQDAAAGLAALRAQGVADGRIVLWGESLGSGLATWLAARERLGAVVLETPYTSIADIAKRRYPFVPVDLLLRDRFESLANMKAIASPVLVLVGARDVVVPAEMGRAIHAAAPAGAVLWEAAEGGHVDLLEHGSMDAVAAFLGRHLRAVQ